MPKSKRKPKAVAAATRKGRRAARGSAPKLGSSNLIEMAMERYPAKWAAYQIAAKNRPDVKTVGKAMDIIEAIVNEAILMDRHWQVIDAARCLKHRAQNDQAQRLGDNNPKL